MKYTVWITKYRVQNTHNELRNTEYEIQIQSMKYTVWNTKYRVQNTHYELRNTEYEI